MQIKKLLDKHRQTAFTINHDQTAAAALDVMTAEGARVLIVMHGDQPVGIVTKGDLLHVCQSNPKTPWDKLDIAEVMTKELITTTPEESVQSAIAAMADARIRHLPVLDKRRIVGILESETVLTFQLDILRNELEELKDYIAQLHDAPLD